MRMPPNRPAIRVIVGGAHTLASMRGGMRMPPNLTCAVKCRTSATGAASFNEGRHAHAAELAATTRA